MKVRCIIVQHTCSYPGEYAPDIVDARSEYVLEDNREGYAEALRKHQARVGTEYDAVRELDVIIPDSAINQLFEIPTTTAEPQIVARGWDDDSER